jgi:aryl-alcohol dehydrogenase-like predicted oxidoreductase
MTFGEAHSERYGKCSKETAFAIMDSFFKNGGNYLDTANTRVERFCKLLFFDH